MKFLMYVLVLPLLPQTYMDDHYVPYMVAHYYIIIAIYVVTIILYIVQVNIL